MKSYRTNIASQLIEEIEKLIPEYLENEEDRRAANGNVAVCIMDESGDLQGKVFGTDKIRGRESFRVAWMKASQVWITGVRTGEFERLAFNNEIDDHKFGIRRPDFIGWSGGQPLTLPDGSVLSVGFSGFRGITDLEIVQKALAVVVK